MKNDFDPKKFRIILDTIRQAVRCPNCNGGFVEKDIEMIAGDRDAYFVKLSCGNCGLNLVASLVNISGAKNTTNLKASAHDMDFLFEDNKNIFKKEIITTDDVIDVHNFLSGFDGRLR